MSTRERLQRIEAKVRQMEQALGLDNPQVSQAAPDMLSPCASSHLTGRHVCTACESGIATLRCPCYRAGCVCPACAVGKASRRYQCKRAAVPASSHIPEVQRC